MSPRRLDGWEPREVHVHHYDSDGRLTHTVIEREPEWSDDDALQAESLTEFERLTCSGCGSWLPHSTSPGFVGVVETDTCNGCRSLAIVQRTHADKHRDDPRPAAGRPSWGDGLRYAVRPAEPAELVGAIRPE